MAMDVGGKKAGAKSDINVTPLIDVVLVLLIIFMVLTPSMLKNLPMMVPDKSEDTNTPAMPPDSSIMVEYTAKRELTVNGEAAAIESLAHGFKKGGAYDAIRKQVWEKFEASVWPNPDPSSPYGAC